MTTDIFEDFDEESQKLLERLRDSMLYFGSAQSEMTRLKDKEAVLYEKQEIENNLKNKKPCQ